MIASELIHCPIHTPPLPSSINALGLSLNKNLFLDSVTLAMNNSTPQPTNPFELPSDIATLVIGIFGVITNAILLLIMFLDPFKCFHRPNMYFVISLAFSDLSTSIASCMFAWRKYEPSEYLSKVATFAIWASIGNSFVTILLMAIERYIVIRFPMKAKSIITTKRIFIAIASTWVVSTILGAGVSFSKSFHSYIKFGVLIECFVIVLVMLIIYVRMSVLLRKSSKIFSETQFSRHSSTEHGKKPKDAAYQRSLNMVVFYLALVLIITVVPHLIIGQIYLGYIFFYPTHDRPVALTYAPYISFPVELLNFVLNPVIYAYRLPQFRKALCYYLRRKTKKRRHEES